MMVMGDQKSQDMITGRKASNQGGQGRMYSRGCMCSYLDCDDPNSECRTIDLEFSHQLIDSATHFVTADDLRQMVSSFRIRAVVTRVERNKCLRWWETYFKRRHNIFSKIVHRPYTLCPIQNAFRGLKFGAGLLLCAIRRPLVIARCILSNQPT
jgi:hypothetical protein